MCRENGGFEREKTRQIERFIYSPPPINHASKTLVPSHPTLVCGCCSRLHKIAESVN